MKRITTIFLTLSLILLGYEDKILILNSYNAGFEWTDTLNQELIKSLRVEDEISFEYMNLKRIDSLEQIEKFSAYYTSKFSNNEFDIVVAIDDGALNFVVKNKKRYFEDSVVFFAGINSKKNYKGLDKSSYAGIFEKVYIRENIDIILSLDKKVKKLVIINDSFSTLYGVDLKEELLKVEKEYNLEFEFLEVYNKNLLDKLKNYKDNTMILHCFPLRGEFDYSFIEYINEVEELISRPIVSLWDYTFGSDKFLGGYMVTAEKQGRELGKLIDKYRSGVDLIELDYIDDLEAEYIFNYEVMSNFGYSIWDLPKSSKLVNQTIFSYRIFRVLMYLLVIMFILGIWLAMRLIRELKLIKRLRIENEEANSTLEKMNKKLIDQNTSLKGTLDENTRLIEQIDSLLESTINLFKHKNEEEFIKNIVELLFKFIPEMVFSYSYIEYEGYEEFIIGDRKNIFREIIDFHGFPFRKEELFEIFKLKYADKLEVFESKECLQIKLNSQVKDYGLMYLCFDTVEEKHNNYIVKLINHFESLIKIFLTLTERTNEVIKSYKLFAVKLAKIAEAHDLDTGNHVLRVGNLAGYIGEKLGLSEKKVSEIENFAPLHDIGKIYIPLEILKKKGGFSEEEWELMKTHTLKAREILEGDLRFEVALNIALYHHEKFDGSGYPYGLKGNEIPIEAGIVAFADIYDALRSKRSYKEGFSHEKSMDIILNGDARTKPEHFLPEVLEVVMENSEGIAKFWERINES